MHIGNPRASESGPSPLCAQHDQALAAAIVECAEDAITSEDLEGRITSWNQAAERMFGYTREECLGRRMQDLMPSAPNDGGMGESVWKPEDRALPLSVVISPLRDAQGVVIGISRIFRDLSEQQRNSENFRGLLESAPDAMVIVDDAGTIILINSQTEKLFGYKRQELLRQPVEILIPRRLIHQHAEYRHGYFGSPRVRPMGHGRELYGCRRDGTEFPVEISLSPIHTAKGTLVTAAIRDITEQNAAQQRILESLKEKEVLLKEIHHRVKNNLAVISSLFYLQSTQTTDPGIIRILQESQDRVRSLALVHEALYRSDNLAEVDFGDYAGTLALTLIRSYQLSNSRVRFLNEVEPVNLTIEKAVPCGLILNELLSNALKHAFPDERQGVIRLTIRNQADGTCLVRVADDGVGIPPSTDLDRLQSLGLRLVSSLTTQLDGKFELIPGSPGTTAQLILGGT
ncbi:MAG TPA: PAS domain S-box protein [Bryobacteraceae bacterium]|jgi:PAS domain S-box-containing protein